MLATPMRTALLLLVAVAAPAFGDAPSIPPEVEAFVRDRDACDHFRGEPFEGERPEQVARRNFIRESVEIFCPGTDRRLAALKRRFRSDQAVMKILSRYEERIEP
jgi:hypothetical protein